MPTIAEVVANNEAKIDSMVELVTNNFVPASSGVAGVVMIATPDDVLAGVSTNKAISPSALGTTITTVAQAAVSTAIASAGLYTSTLNKSAAYTVLAGDMGGLINVDTSGGAVSITLVDSSGLGGDGEITIAKTTDDANAVTVLAAGTDTVDGGASIVINSKSSVKISLNQATGAWTAAAPVVGAVSSIGKHTMFFPARSLISRTTGGAAAGSAESGTNKVNTGSLDFDATVAEYAQFMVNMPKSWDAGTLTANFVWSHAATTTNFGVAWAIQGVALANDEAVDNAFGAAVVVTDTGGTTDDLYRTSETAAITVANTPAKSDLIVFQVYRDVADAADNMAIDARLLGVVVGYTTDAATDD